MAFLKPDKTTTVNGVTVKEYFLTAHNPNKISLPSPMLGSYDGVTIHNTGIITVNGTTMAEQYTRSTVNGNMGSVCVHLYTDAIEAWQNLPFTYQSWHAGQKGKSDAHGSEKGNAKTISIECIMGGNKGYEKAEDNAARLAAWLLVQRNLSIDRLYTHNYWCNVRDGITGTVDQLNTQNDHYKNCPVYIRPHWLAFKAKVLSYMQQLSGDVSVKYYVQVGAFSNKILAEKYLVRVKKDYPDSFVKYIKETGLYYVQAGAFSSRANAEKFLAEVKKTYPDAFIKVM